MHWAAKIYSEFLTETYQKVLPLNMPIIAWWYKVCLSCPYFSGKYGAPPTRTPKCIDENKNDICDSEEETEETTKDPVSLHDNFTYSESVEKHEFIWNLYLAISNLQTKLERGKRFSK